MKTGTDVAALVTAELDLPVMPVPVSGQMMLEDLFPGKDYKDLRDEIVQTGVYTRSGSKKELKIQTRTLEDGRHEILALAALSRDPGSTNNYLQDIADFSNLGFKPTTNLQQRVRQYKEIYRNEGLINNAVNKVAALVGVGGSFRVRRAKKGKQRKAVEQLQAALDYFTKNVNASALGGVITSERGVKAMLHTGARQALVEGDWLARQQWAKVNLGSDVGAFSLPMTIQTMSMTTLTPVLALAGLGELWYWTPDAELMNLLTGSKPAEKAVADVVKNLIDTKTLAELKKNRRVLLSPALLMHVKHRGFATDAVGESIIEPAKLGIRYGRAITAIDLVSMENVINRLTIVQVGSADPKSPYSKADVAAARAALMQSFFEEVSPSMVLVWQGDDVEVTDVGSQDAILALDGRFAIGDTKIKSALGLPDALLLGEAGDGATADWASVIGASAQIQELANSFGTVLTSLGERIAVENGFADIDLVWEFDASIMTDLKTMRSANRSDYALGLLSIRSMIAGAGRDPEAEFQQRCLEQGLPPESTTYEEAFRPPQGLQGQADGGVRGQGDGKDPGAGRAPREE
jgi:hypothetical protein